MHKAPMHKALCRRPHVAEGPYAKGPSQETLWHRKPYTESPIQKNPMQQKALYRRPCTEGPYMRFLSERIWARLQGLHWPFRFALV